MCPGEVEIKGLGHISTVGSIRFESGSGSARSTDIEFSENFGKREMVDYTLMVAALVAGLAVAGLAVLFGRKKSKKN